MDNLWLKWENIVAKGEIARFDFLSFDKIGSNASGAELSYEEKG